MLQHKPDHPCPRAKPTLPLAAIYYEPHQIPIPEEISHELALQIYQSSLKITYG